MNQKDNQIKPSNITGIINNKIESGKVKTELEIYLTENQELKILLQKVAQERLGVSIQKIKLKYKIRFFFDKSDFLIKNIFGLLDERNKKMAMSE